MKIALLAACEEATAAIDEMIRLRHSRSPSLNQLHGWKNLIEALSRNLPISSQTPAGAIIRSDQGDAKGPALATGTPPVDAGPHALQEAIAHPSYALGYDEGFARGQEDAALGRGMEPVGFVSEDTLAALTSGCSGLFRVGTPLHPRADLSVPLYAVPVAPSVPVTEGRGEALARPSGHVNIAHDGFAGDIIGHYVTREGKPGVVVQQDGTRVVHVYGEKWLVRFRRRRGEGAEQPEADPNG